MRVMIDTARNRVEILSRERTQRMELYSEKAFQLISELWLKVGWNLNYTYAFSWLGRPIVQLPEDLIRIQEVIVRVAPDVIVETGVAHGGSTVFYASLCKLLAKGRVIGIDVNIRPENRAAIESHCLASLITLIGSDSSSPSTVNQVRELVEPGERVFVVLDSDHSKAHVARELEAYAPLVSSGSYIVAMDGIMRELYDAPRGRPEWAWDNPAAAAEEFAARHPEFVLEQPSWPFNESNLSTNVTYWPSAWLRRL